MIFITKINRKQKIYSFRGELSSHIDFSTNNKYNVFQIKEQININNIQEKNYNKKMNKFIFLTLFLCIFLQLETVDSSVRPGLLKMFQIKAPSATQGFCPGTMCKETCPGRCCVHPQGIAVECCPGCRFCALKGLCPPGPGPVGNKTIF